MLIPMIVRNRIGFLALRGDFSELVKVTFFDECRAPSLSGWYVFERNRDTNLFVSQNPAHLDYSELISKVVASTEQLQFDRDLGIMLGANCYEYQSLGKIHQEEYNALKARLIAVEQWREAP